MLPFFYAIPKPLAIVSCAVNSLRCLYRSMRRNSFQMFRCQYLHLMNIEFIIETQLSSLFGKLSIYKRKRGNKVAQFCNSITCSSHFEWNNKKKLYPYRFALKNANKNVKSILFPIFTVPDVLEVTCSPIQCLFRAISIVVVWKSKKHGATNKLNGKV